MVGEAGNGDWRARVREYRDGIAGLEIVLAAANAVGKCPRRNQVHAERIVHPLLYLVAERSHIRQRAAEDTGVDPACPQERLHLDAVAAHAGIESGRKTEHE